MTPNWKPPYPRWHSSCGDGCTWSDVGNWMNITCIVETTDPDGPVWQAIYWKKLDTCLSYSGATVSSIQVVRPISEKRAKALLHGKTMIAVTHDPKRIGQPGYSLCPDCMGTASPGREVWFCQGGIPGTTYKRRCFAAMEGVGIRDHYWYPTADPKYRPELSSRERGRLCTRHPEKNWGKPMTETWTKAKTTPIEFKFHAEAVDTLLDSTKAADKLRQLKRNQT